MRDRFRAPPRSRQAPHQASVKLLFEWGALLRDAGQLDDALDQLADYLERDAETRRELKSAVARALRFMRAQPAPVEAEALAVAGAVDPERQS